MVFFIGSTDITLTNLEVKDNYYGLYFLNATNVALSSSTIANNTFEDIELFLPSASSCSYSLSSVTGTGNLPISFISTNAVLSNAQYSELILCNADGASLNRVNLSANAKNNGLKLFFLIL